jgi:hypothetical protein
MKFGTVLSAIFSIVGVTQLERNHTRRKTKERDAGIVAAAAVLSPLPP